MQSKTCLFVKLIDSQPYTFELKSTQGLKDNRFGHGLGWVSFQKIVSSYRDDVINRGKIYFLISKKPHVFKLILRPHGVI